jgi:beta-barrel assembly-enhancing protease
LLKEREYQPTIVDGWFASHPLEESRIAKAKQLIAAVEPTHSGRFIVDTPEFQAFKTRVSQLPAPPRPQQLPDSDQQP